MMAEKKQNAATEEAKETKNKATEVPEENVEMMENETVTSEENAETGAESKEDVTEATEIPIEVELEEEKVEEDAAQKYLNQLQLLQAEFQNFKKRTEREKKEIAKYIKGEFIKKLLPVIDDLERSLQNHEGNAEVDGFRLIQEKLMRALKEEGLEEVAATGNKFDPNYHDALYTQEVEAEEDDGKVLEEWEKGFFFQGSLLRASKVKVGKKTNKNE